MFMSPNIARGEPCLTSILLGIKWQCAFRMSVVISEYSDKVKPKNKRFTRILKSKIIFEILKQQKSLFSC